MEQVGNLFAVQYLGFQTPDLFTSTLNQVQQAQLYGKVLDRGFEGKASMSKWLQQLPKQKFFFQDDQLTFVTKASPAPKQVQINSSGIQTFQEQNAAFAPGQHANAYADRFGMQGINSGNRTVQVMKAALAIASRATESQLEEGKVGQGIKHPGVLKSYFEAPVVDENPPVFVEKFSRFLDPVTVRSALIDFSVSNKTGHNDPQVIGQMQVDQMTPGESLAIEARVVKNASARNSLIRDAAAASIRMQRLAPRYSQLGSTQPMNLIRRINDQERRRNGFKVSSNNRFA